MPKLLEEFLVFAGSLVLGALDEITILYTAQHFPANTNNIANKLSSCIPAH